MSACVLLNLVNCLVFPNRFNKFNNDHKCKVMNHILFNILAARCQDFTIGKCYSVMEAIT